MDTGSQARINALEKELQDIKDWLYGATILWPANALVTLNVDDWKLDSNGYYYAEAFDSALTARSGDIPLWEPTNRVGLPSKSEIEDAQQAGFLGVTIQGDNSFIFRALNKPQINWTARVRLLRPIYFGEDE